AEAAVLEDRQRAGGQGLARGVVEQQRARGRGRIGREVAHADGLERLLQQGYEQRLVRREIDRLRQRVRETRALFSSERLSMGREIADREQRARALALGHRGVPSAEAAFTGAVAAEADATLADASLLAVLPALVGTPREQLRDARQLVRRRDQPPASVARRSQRE